MASVCGAVWGTSTSHKIHDLSGIIITTVLVILTAHGIVGMTGWTEKRKSLLFRAGEFEKHFSVISMIYRMEMSRRERKTIIEPLRWAYLRLCQLQVNLTNFSIHTQPNKIKENRTVQFINYANGKLSTLIISCAAFFLSVSLFPLLVSLHGLFHSSSAIALLFPTIRLNFNVIIIVYCNFLRCHGKGWKMNKMIVVVSVQTNLTHLRSLNHSPTMSMQTTSTHLQCFLICLNRHWIDYLETV